MFKALTAAGAALLALAASASTALACGGLVAPDGDVRLDKATTFVAWSDGIEHYVTSFAYRGSAADVGWIVPLPAVPEHIGLAGRWTLQRLELEVQPPVESTALQAGGAAAPASAVVVERVQVEALDVRVLKGSGQAVVDWCANNGFALNQETRDHLLRYAQASPIFMAAKYNASTAQARGLAAGDGVPLMLTMRTPRLWIPLEVLANDDTTVNADLFVLTDSRPQPLPAPNGWLFPLGASSDVDGAPGLTIAKQEPMNDALHADLSRDRGMSWVPASGWLTYLTLDAPSEQVTYDLSVAGDSVIRLDAFGTKLDTPPRPLTGSPLLPATLTAMAALACAAGAYLAMRRRGAR